MLFPLSGQGAGLLGNVRVQDGASATLATIGSGPTFGSGLAGLIGYSGLYAFDVSGGANMARLMERVPSQDLATTDIQLVARAMLDILDTGGAVRRLQGTGSGTGALESLLIAPAVPVTTASAPGNDNAGVLVTSRTVKAAAGKLFRATFTNTSAAARWLQVFDNAAVPADGAVPLISIPIAAGAKDILDFGIYGRQFANGITLVHSTTGPTKTIEAVASALIDTQFV